MAEKRILVTSALPYANGPLHVGHIAGAYLPADIFVRYLRAAGRRVAFICGSDEHGVPNTLAAKKEGLTIKQLVDKYHDEQLEEFTGLGIHFDNYGGTTAPQHYKVSQKFFSKVLANGFLTKKTIQQLYDPTAEMFLPDRYVEGTCPHCKEPGARGDQCESCGRQLDPMELIDPTSKMSDATPVVRDTTHWFFELGKFETQLGEWLDGHPEWRTQVLNFSKGQLKMGLPARCITRDMDWGIPVPLPDDKDAAGKVLYVWFDAPIGYVSFTAQWCEENPSERGTFEDWWKSEDCEIYNYIGEDNVVFHAIMWPAMLMAEGSFQLATNVVANAFLNVRLPEATEDEKISTSRHGRDLAVWIGKYLQEFEPDTLRYYLTAIAPESARTTFRFDDLISRNNDELVAALGNFFNRSVTFIHKYFDGKVPPRVDESDADAEQIASLPAVAPKVGELIEGHRYRDALGEVMAAARAANKYFDTKKPWAQRKEDLAACGTTMNVCVQTCRTLTTVMAPFLPFATAKAREMLGLDEADLAWEKAAEPIPDGTPLGEAVILFKKLDVAKSS